jgi:hypothetical protein
VDTKMRRVVTGIDEQGKSVFVSDATIEARIPAALGGNEIFVIWGADETPTVPNTGDAPPQLRFFPTNPDGYRFIVFSQPPDAKVTVPDDLEAALEEMEELTPGMGDAVSENSGAHYTATVDLEYVLDGEFTLELDDGVRKVLRKGDSLVQCGPRHAWHNEGDTMATMLLVFIGARLDAARFASTG